MNALVGGSKNKGGEGGNRDESLIQGGRIEGLPRKGGQGRWKRWEDCIVWEVDIRQIDLKGGRENDG